MNQTLKILAWLEGTSLLLLFFVAMPVKYVWGNPELVQVVGMAHGLLFLAFVGLLTALAPQPQWGWKKVAIGYVCSVLPFGTFWFERKYLTPGPQS